MKVFIKKLANVIRMPEDEYAGARLLQLTADGHFEYQISYKIDPSVALREEASVVKIHVSVEPLLKASVTTMDSFNPTAMTKGILTKTPRQKDFIRSENEKKLMTITSDFKTRIPRVLAPDLVRKTATAPTIRTDFTISPVSVDVIDRSGVVLPVLDTSTTGRVTDRASSTAGITLASDAVRVDSTGLLFTRRTDPAAAVGSKTYMITSAVHAIAGTIPESVSSRVMLSKEDSSPARLIGSLLRDVPTITRTMLGKSDVMNVASKTSESTLTVTETVMIPISLISVSEFYLTFELTKATGVIIQSLSKAVPHASNVAKLKIPVEPPELVVRSLSQFGRNILNIRQVDDNATSVKLYRRVVSKAASFTDATYNHIGSVRVSSRNGFVRVEDRVASTNPIIYRVVAVNEDGVSGAEFASAVIEQPKGITSRRGFFNRRPYGAVVIAELSNNVVNVAVKSIPAGVKSVAILKKDVSLKSKPLVRLTAPVLVKTNSTLPILFQDSQVFPGRSYEYSVELYYPDGTVEVSKSTFLEYQPLVTNVVEATISEPEVIAATNGNVDVIFNITKEIVKGNMDFIKSLLQAQGLLPEFQAEVLANRDKLQQVFATRVIRQNLSTGECEDFGIIDDGEFSDVKFGRKKGVKPLESGFEYSYTVQIFGSPPERLFSTFSKTVTSADGETSYTFKPSKWHHPIALNEGTLVSEGSLARNHGKSELELGRMVEQKVITVSLAEFLPSVVEASATRFGSRSVLIRWKVQGNLNKIDHFIILLEMMGMRTVVGKSHNISSTNQLQFVDLLTNKECGKLVYLVVPVYYDYARGSESRTNAVII
jgi:hypothetical protein